MALRALLNRPPLRASTQEPSVLAAPAAAPSSSGAATDSRFDRDFSGVRNHTDAAVLQRAPAIQVARPRYTTKPASDVCPSCLCSEDQLERIDDMRERTAEVLDHAAGQLLSPPKVTRLFEKSFGEGSATRENLDHVHETLKGAMTFLRGSRAGENIHCDSANASAGCAGGAPAFHEAGHVVLCLGAAITGKMMDPPKVSDVVRAVRPNEESSELRVDEEATAKNQKASDAKWDAYLMSSILAHEAVHARLQPGVVDVYRGERLYQFLGSEGAKGVDLSPIAMDNPDSLVSFAFKSLALGGREELAPGAAEVLSSSDKLSGELSVRPLLGRRGAKLAMAMTQEAIEQAEGRIRALHSEVASVKGGSSAWQSFSQASQDLAGLLRSSGGEKALANPDKAAEERLLEILEGLSLTRNDLLEKRTVIARRFLWEKPDKRVEIAIPDWKEFRRLPLAEQIQRLLKVLLRRDPRTASLAGFVWEHARLRGGFRQVAPTSPGDAESTPPAAAPPTANASGS
jgi:hypothetical protein